MFDQLSDNQEPKHEEPYSGALKGIVVSAVGLLLGLGLCGAGAALHGSGVVGPFAVLGLIVLAVSAIGLFGSFVALVLSLLWSYFSRKP